jgi:hypothetical protein
VHEIWQAMASQAHCCRLHELQLRITTRQANVLWHLPAVIAEWAQQWYVYHSSLIHVAACLT